MDSDQLFYFVICNVNVKEMRIFYFIKVLGAFKRERFGRSWLRTFGPQAGAFRSGRSKEESDIDGSVLSEPRFPRRFSVKDPFSCVFWYNCYRVKVIIKYSFPFSGGFRGGREM